MMTVMQRQPCSQRPPPSLLDLSSAAAGEDVGFLARRRSAYRAYTVRLASWSTLLLFLPGIFYANKSGRTPLD